MNERRSNKLIWFLLLSLLFHSLLVLLLIPIPPQQKIAELEPIAVEILPKRIADIAKPKEQKRPKRADFLGQYDSTVKEEQVAVTPQQPGVPRPQKSIERVEPQKPADTDAKKLAALYSRKKEDARRKRESIREEALQKPGAFPHDFYPDYKVGPHTYLNVLRFPDVQYFVRLKRIFKLTFNPVRVLRQYIYSNQISRGHVEVVLGVVVDSGGRLARLFVIRGSGLGNYDNEALRTVRDSSPFSKPPSKLLGADGQLRMSWTFTVYL